MIGHIDRVTWCRGTETSANETFETAMLRVRSVEKATSVKFSLIRSRVSLIEPDLIMKKQPIDVDEVWRVVSSHGNRACLIVSLTQ